MQKKSHQKVSSPAKPQANSPKKPPADAKASPKKVASPAPKLVESPKKPIKVEEEKKVEKVEDKLPTYTTIKLTEADTVLDSIHKKDKSTIVIDKTGNFSTFLKYKGSQADYVEHSLLEKMGKKKREEFLELCRVSIYISMKNGHTCAFYFDQVIINIAEYFQGTQFFVLPDLFIPSKLENKEFYRKNVLTEAEDVDAFGNKGYFQVREGFKICLLFNQNNPEEVLSKIGLPLELFEVVIIEN